MAGSPAGSTPAPVAAAWHILGSRHIPFSALTTPPAEEEERRRTAVSDVQSRSVLAAGHGGHS